MVTKKVLLQVGIEPISISIYRTNVPILRLFAITLFFTKFHISHRTNQLNKLILSEIKMNVISLESHLHSCNNEWYEKNSQVCIGPKSTTKAKRKVPCLCMVSYHMSSHLARVAVLTYFTLVLSSCFHYLF